MQRREFISGSLCAAASLSAPSLRLAAESIQTTLTVQTKAGPVTGRVQDGITSFRGIPYGADTRTTRFQPPKPPEPWTKPLDCFEWADRAPQLGGPERAARNTTRAQADGYHLPPDEGEQSENCLHLNVWTPEASSRDHKPRPVLVYIHGGAYNSGTVNAALYDGTRLARRGNAVVVTLNHRLNAFGYLYLAGVTNDPAYRDSGNVGQLDLVLALEWVRDNIANFGGDPSRVTIWGQSGGGAKCATLMALPAAHGLFHRIMSMSGQQVTAAPKNIATARTKQFLEKLGLSSTPSSELRAKLDALPMADLQAAARVSSAWLPVVDGTALPRDPFDPDAPSISNGVPMILGNTHDETRGLIGSSQPALFSLTWADLPLALTKNVGQYLGPVTPERVISSYREWYPSYTPTDVFFAAATAFRSWPGQVIEAQRRAANPEAAKRTWVYQMDWRSPVGGGRFGAPHTVDIAFFFDNLALSPGMVGAGDAAVAAAQPLADAMSSALLAFAATGDPNCAAIPHWPVYSLQADPAKRFTMLWNTPPHVAADPRGNERRLAAEAHYRQPGT